MGGLYPDVGVDLGTANTLVFVRGRGVVVREPSVVAVDQHDGRILAFGNVARRMLGRTPGHIVAHRPLRNGVIADYGLTEAMLRHYVGRVSGRFFRPRVMVCVPSGITTVEKRAIAEATQAAGARKTYLIEEPLAAAIGAGIDIASASGSMVADIGGGTSDVAVLSLNGIVLSASLRVGGDRLDEAIVRYVKREHHLVIGDRTAEDVKIEVGTAFPSVADHRVAEVRGRDTVTGLPRTVRLSAREVCSAIDEPLMAITRMVRSVLERTPPELAADVLDKGLLLTGGGALLDGLDGLLSHEVGLPVHVAEDALSCVALGMGRALEGLDGPRVRPALQYAGV